MPEMSEASAWLQAHEAEFKPVVSDPSFFDRLREAEVTTPDSLEVAQAIEEVSTKVYRFDKPPGDYQPDAQRVLLTASEPLAKNSIAPLIERLRSDPRVRGIGLVTDNVAGKQFEHGLEGFECIEDPTKPVLADALSMAESEPFDIAIVPVDPPNSPNSVALYGAKSVFGARRLYFLATGWVGVGATRLFDQPESKQMDSIDGIFCNDELAKDILRRQLPDFPAEHILVTGTPVVDALEVEKAAEYTAAGRQRLGLNDATITVLFLGHVSGQPGSAESGLHPRISEHTFELTLEQAIQAAKANPQREMALLVRPHPRDPNSAELLELAQRETPANLHVIPADLKSISMQEAAYAADGIASIIGTDNFLASRRGRKGIFLGYEGPGMGGDLLRQYYDPGVQEVIEHSSSMTIARQPEDFAHMLASLERAQPPEMTEKSDSIARILDAALQPDDAK